PCALPLSVREPIVLIDDDLKVVMYNAAFSELFGIEGDARGQSLDGIGDGAWDDDETLRRLRDVCARGRELWDYELRQRTADGIERVMLVNARLMELPDADAHVALITASDIDRKSVV